MQIFSAVALLSLSPLAVASDLWVGPPGSGTPFVVIQAALDAAAPGDRVLLLPGTYLEALVITKPVELIGSGAEDTRVLTLTFAVPGQIPPPLRVSGIGAGQRVAIRGLHLGIHPVVPGIHPLHSVVSFTDCAGLVELADAVISGANLPRPPQGSAGGALFLQDVAQATLTRVVATGSGSASGLGNMTPGEGTDGMDGLSLLRSKAAAVDCEFTGGAGGASAGGQGGQGGAGARAVDAELWLARTRCAGGASAGASVALAGQGGSGLEVEGATALVHGGEGAQLVGADAREMTVLFVTTIHSGGHGVLAGATSQVELAPDVALQAGAPTTNMPAGQTVSAAPGASVVQLAERAPSLAFEPGLAPLGGSTVIEYRGAPGSVHLRALALGTAPGLSLPGLIGELQLNPGLYALTPAVVLHANGVFDLPTPLPALPAFAGLSLAEQSLQLTGSELRFAPPALFHFGL
jgi:hypothetical protein